MTVIKKTISLNSNGNTDIIDITQQVSKKITESNINNGIVTVFCPGATGGLTTIEYEPGLVDYDFENALEKIAPENQRYKHNDTWHDGNGHSHVRASLIGPSITVPFNNKHLELGTWQQIVFIDFDVRQRNRNLVLQILGE